MANKIKLGCTFCFRGEYFTPSIEVDLDVLMVKDGELPNFYPLLAQANNIGLYTYEFEILEAEAITAEAIDGWVEKFILEGRLDISGFENHSHSAYIADQLEAIALIHQQKGTYLFSVSRLGEERKLKGRRNAKKSPGAGATLPTSHCPTRPQSPGGVSRGRGLSVLSG